MATPISSEPGGPNEISENSSSTYLLECGLHCTRQGRYHEGASYLALARQGLSSDQMYLAPVLDAIVRGFVGFWQAQEALLQASKTFARVDSEQQAQLDVLESLLPAPVGEAHRIPPDAGWLSHNASANEASRGFQPASEGFARDQFSKQLSFSTHDDMRGDPPLSPSSPEDSSTLPALYITCFKRFEVRRFGQPVVLCSSRNGQTILRYLVIQSGHCATIDTLMTLLWAEDESEVAQRKLHLAISALRHSLNRGYTSEPGGGYIVCRNRVYYLNSAAVIRTDVDEFLRCYQAGQQADKERVPYYERACSLYTGPLLPDDMYADWSFLQRERMSRAYIAMCEVLADHYLGSNQYEDAAKWANAILQENRCDELAHRQLIQIYAAQGRRSEALQQYLRCESILRKELDVPPVPETTRLMQTLLQTNAPQQT